MTSLLVFPGALLGRYAAFTMGPGGKLPNLPLSAPEKKDFPREFSKKGKLRSPNHGKLCIKKRETPSGYASRQARQPPRSWLLGKLEANGMQFIYHINRFIHHIIIHM